MSSYVQPDPAYTMANLHLELSHHVAPTRPPLPLKVLRHVAVTTPFQAQEVDRVVLRRRESLLARMSISPLLHSTHPTTTTPLRTTTRPLSEEELIADAASHAPAHLVNAHAPTAPTRIRRNHRARKSPRRSQE